MGWRGPPSWTERRKRSAESTKTYIITFTVKGPRWKSSLSPGRQYQGSCMAAAPTRSADVDAAASQSECRHLVNNLEDVLL